jgi:hypothetical protein
MRISGIRWRISPLWHEPRFLIHEEKFTSNLDTLSGRAYMPTRVAINMAENLGVFEFFAAATRLFH